MATHPPSSILDSPSSIFLITPAVYPVDKMAGRVGWLSRNFCRVDRAVVDNSAGGAYAAVA
jgi:hypothetical protein